MQLQASRETCQELLDSSDLLGVAAEGSEEKASRLEQELHLCLEREKEQARLSEDKVNGLQREMVEFLDFQREPQAIAAPERSQVTPKPRPMSSRSPPPRSPPATSRAPPVQKEEDWTQRLRKERRAAAAAAMRAAAGTVRRESLEAEALAQELCEARKVTEQVERRPLESGDMLQAAMEAERACFVAAEARLRRAEERLEDVEEANRQQCSAIQMEAQERVQELQAAQKSRSEMAVLLDQSESAWMAMASEQVTGLEHRQEAQKQRELRSFELRAAEWFLLGETRGWMEGQEAEAERVESQRREDQSALQQQQTSTTAASAEASAFKAEAQTLRKEALSLRGDLGKEDRQEKGLDAHLWGLKTS